MAKKNLLTDKSARAAGLGKHGDGEGLQLVVRQTAGGVVSRNWVFRFRMPGGKSREMGLGVFPLVSLQAARELRDDARRLIVRGVDPLEARTTAQVEQRAAEDLARAARDLTFEKVAEMVRAKQEFTNDKHIEQWDQSLAAHVFPVIGAKPVAQVDKDDMVVIIEPVLKSSPDTARKLRGRLENIMGYAIANEWHPGPNPARHAGHMEKLLPRLKKSEGETEHYVAMPHGYMPEFIARLRASGGGRITASCALFAILCAARGGEVRRAQWKEIEWGAEGGPVWHVPAAHMKRRKPHEVPLSPAAVRILESLPKGKPGDLIFPTPKTGRESEPISDAGLLKVVQDVWQAVAREDTPSARAVVAKVVLAAQKAKSPLHALKSKKPKVIKGLDDADVPAMTLHGTRSSFSDWAHEQTLKLGDGHQIKRFSEVEVELSLSHAVGDAVMRAYMRTDLPAARRRLMEAWAAHCMGEAQAATNVVPLQRAA